MGQKRQRTVAGQEQGQGERQRYRPAEADQPAGGRGNQRREVAGDHQDESAGRANGEGEQRANGEGEQRSGGETERRRGGARRDRDPGLLAAPRSEEADATLRELVAYLREHRTELREQWARRISEAELLRVMSEDEISSEATVVLENYLDALETGRVEKLQSYARELSERIIARGVETDEVLGIVLLLRDVLARSLFAKYQYDLDQRDQILDSYEPAANQIAVTVGVSFVEERERVIEGQQETMRELSTPVLQLGERLLILPIIGVLDSARARELTEQLLGAIQRNRARVVVIDITGVATVDRAVANHLVQTVEASRLIGASTILTGLSSEIAQTLVDLDVDLGMMKTVDDLQGGLEEAERLAGYRRRDPGDPIEIDD